MITRIGESGVPDAVYERAESRLSRMRSAGSAKTSFSRIVPRDAVAHIHEHLADAALQMMKTNMRAKITDADTLF